MLKLKNRNIVLNSCTFKLGDSINKLFLTKQQQQQISVKKQIAYLKLLNKKQLEIFFKLRHQTTAAAVLENDVNNDVAAKQEWQNAKPFEEMPTVRSLKFLRNFLPGGKYSKLDSKQLLLAFKDDLGNVVRFPGFLGRKGIVFTHNVQDFEKVFRNEGVWPNRPGSEALHYHRHVHRADFFKGTEGLLSTQGEIWAKFRSIVNPVLLQPRNIELYLNKMSQVNKEFIERIRQIRDPQSLEVPDTFQEEINRWTLESVSVVALDKQLGLISKNRDDAMAKQLFKSLSDFFSYSFDLEVKPSIWKYYRTPTFKKFIKTSDTIGDITSFYVNEAVERIEKGLQSGEPEKPESEKSVLEKLIKVNKKVAIVMAMDMLMGGVDTTTSAFVGLLLCMAKNPEKQEKLRQEVLKILPQKDSEFDDNSLRNMSYIRASIKESLRIHPLALASGRVLVKDVVISGYRVPKGTQVISCSISQIHNSDHFPRANEYLPERWLRPRKETENTLDCPHSLKPSSPFLHLPFGFGPRSCIGRRLAEMELQLGIARLLRNFYIDFNYPTENAFKGTVINVPNIPLKFKFTDVNY